MICCGNYKEGEVFEMAYDVITLPDEIDPDNLNNRLIGSTEVELVKATRSGEGVNVHFTLRNKKEESHTFMINGSTSYDGKGGQHNSSHIAYGTPATYNYFRKIEKEVVANSNLDTYFLIENIPDNIEELKRIDIMFQDFDLTWNDVKIHEELSLGKSISEDAELNSRSAEYLNYSDFEAKVRNNETVVGKKVILEKIYFNTGSDDILTESYSQLGQISELLNLNQTLKVEISGHTDNTGEELANMLLSQKRADAIRYFLIGKSINPQRVTSVGKGESEPIASNETQESRKGNRRVEITILN